MKDDFLRLVKKGISMGARKQILKNILLGHAELHDQQIVHLGMFHINPASRSRS